MRQSKEKGRTEVLRRTEGVERDEEEEGEQLGEKRKSNKEKITG